MHTTRKLAMESLEGRELLTAAPGCEAAIFLNEFESSDTVAVVAEPSAAPRFGAIEIIQLHETDPTRLPGAPENNVAASGGGILNDGGTLTVNCLSLKRGAAENVSQVTDQEIIDALNNRTQLTSGSSDSNALGTNDGGGGVLNTGNDMLESGMPGTEPNQIIAILIALHDSGEGGGLWNPSVVASFTGDATVNQATDQEIIDALNNGTQLTASGDDADRLHVTNVDRVFEEAEIFDVEVVEIDRLLAIRSWQIEAIMTDFDGDGDTDIFQLSQGDEATELKGALQQDNDVLNGTHLPVSSARSLGFNTGMPKSTKVA